MAEQLFSEGYGAVLMATGAQRARSSASPGTTPQGVVEGVTFLRDLNLNKAIKAKERWPWSAEATSPSMPPGLLRLGATSWRSSTEGTGRHACQRGRDRRSGKGRSAHPYARHTEARGSQEGQRDRDRVRPRFPRQLRRSGRRKPEVIEGSEFVMPVDMIIAAIGQKPDLTYLNGDGVQRDRRRHLKGGRALATTRAGVLPQETTCVVLPRWSRPSRTERTRPWP